MPRFVLGLIVCAMCVSPAAAQDEDEKPDGQKPNIQRFRAVFPAAGLYVARTGGDPANLTRNPNVQKELELSDEQKTAIGKTFTDAVAKRRELSLALRGLQGAERQKKLTENRKKLQEIAASTNKAVRKSLNEEQSVRLDQIALQLQGIRALSDKKVGKDEITDEQSKQMARLQAKLRDEQQQLQQNIQNGVVERAKAAEKRKELIEKNEAATLEVLTKQQQAKFEKMKGEKFEMPQRRALNALPFRIQIRPGNIQPRRIQRAQPKEAKPAE